MVLQNPVYKQKQAKNIFQTVQTGIKGQPDLISMAIGDSFGPLHPKIVEAMIDFSRKMGRKETFLGYPPEEGIDALKEAINQRFYQGQFSLNEIFISDGIKGDIYKLQTLLGPNLIAYHNDLAYPVYKEGTHLVGSSALPLLTNKQNGFIPDFSTINKADVIYVCSPNNPTGVALPFSVMSKGVDKAKKMGAFLVHDACYSPYIQSLDCPKSVYEIPGAREVSIELGSFSKWAGLSGIRLSWIVIPKQIIFENGESLLESYQTMIVKTYNGASRIAQTAGLSILAQWEDVALEAKKILKNGEILKQFFVKKGNFVTGGEDGPYLFVETDFDFLEKTNILTVPGEAFAPSGRGFKRMSLFVDEENFYKVMERLQKHFR